MSRRYRIDRIVDALREGPLSDADTTAVLLAAFERHADWLDLAGIAPETSAPLAALENALEAFEAAGEDQAAAERVHRALIARRDAEDDAELERLGW